MDPISASRALNQTLAANPTAQLAQADQLKGISSIAPPKIAPSELQQISPLSTHALAPSQQVSPGGSPASFDHLLSSFVHDVNAKQNAASQTVSQLLGGQNVSLHQAMIAMEEASVSFQLMVEVRNKLLDSYQELMRMQI